MNLNCRNECFFAVDPEGTKGRNSDCLVEEQKQDGNIVPLVHWVAVIPSAQRQGIARGLVTKVIETCQNQTADSEESAAAIFSIRKHGVMLRLDCINN